MDEVNNKLKKSSIIRCPSSPFIFFSLHHKIYCNPKSCIEKVHNDIKFPADDEVLFWL